METKPGIICFLVVDITKKKVLNVTSFQEMAFFKSVLLAEGDEIQTRMNSKCITEEYSDYALLKLPDLFSDIGKYNSTDGRKIFLRVMRKITNNIAKCKDYEIIRDTFNNNFIEAFKKFGCQKDKNDRIAFFTSIFINSIAEYANKTNLINIES